MSETNTSENSVSQNKKSQLPPGQFEVKEMRRFGLPPYANRFPKNSETVEIKIKGEVEQEIVITEKELGRLARANQTSDFHCVATWSCLQLQWSGYKFRDLYEQIILPQVKPKNDANFIILRAQDGYRTNLILEDILSDDVLLADTLNGQRLPIEHGAPLRLVAPAHYGYKNLKHVKQIEFCFDDSTYNYSRFRFLTHPRGRVAYEERGEGVPGWLLRYVYRPMIRSTAAKFKKAMNMYHNQKT